MRQKICALLCVGSSLVLSCKTRLSSESRASSTDESQACFLPKGVPVLSIAVDPGILPPDARPPTPTNSAVIINAARGTMLINQINNDLCRDHDEDYVAQLRVAIMSEVFKPSMHAVISPNPDPQLDHGIMKILSIKNQPPCHDGSLWVNMAKLAHDTSNSPLTMSKFMTDAFQFSYLFIGKPSQYAGRTTCDAGISEDDLALKQNEFEVMARHYLNEVP